jgi:hypothetical protein
VIALERAEIEARVATLVAAALAAPGDSKDA